MNNIIGIERTPFIPTMPYMPGGQTPVYVGTITGLKISSVAGTAFVDGLNAAVLALPLDATHSIEIYDSSNRFLRGVLKAVGVAETTVNRLSDASFDDAAKWTLGNWSVSGGQASINNSGVLRDQTGTGTARALYKRGVTIASRVSGNVYMPYTGNGADGVAGSVTVTTLNQYRTIAVTDSISLYSLAFNGVLDSCQFDQVLTPSSSGATIQVSKTDSTENFGYGDASFTYNATSYVVRVYTIR
jgi:hypothetical protein